MGEQRTTVATARPAGRTGRTAVEKVLARAAGKAAVHPGDIVFPVPDLVVVHDGYFETLARQLLDLGISRVFDPDRFVVVTDHEVAYTGANAAARGQANREFAARLGVTRFFDAGDGGHGHVMPVEQGMVASGDFVFAYDVHVSNYGAVGAVALHTGAEIVSVAATGTLWTQVPETVRLRLTGDLAPGVSARDVAAALARDLVSGEVGGSVDNCSVELTGPGLAAFGTDGRMTLCNTITEVGVATVVVDPGGQADPDAEYRADVEIDLTALPPLVSPPPSPVGAVPVTELEGKRVHHAVIGSCANGMYDDMRAAAEVLRGRRVAPGVRLIITPATQRIYRQCLVDGIVTTFAEAGALVTPPGCGPCAGGKLGAMASGEVSISSIATNHEGRMGATDSEIYLASPATVAASAVAGHIADPRELLAVSAR